MKHARRPHRRSLPRDDRAISAVVGVLLVLALLVTVYANAVITDVPRYGAQAERDWDAGVKDAAVALSHGMAGVVGTDTPATAVFPGPPTPQALDVPLIGRTEPMRAAGSLSFEPACGGLTITHLYTGSGSRVSDLVGGSPGCLRFRPQPAYSAMPEYVVELGGVVRVQRDGAVVLQGPPLDLNRTAAGVSRVSLVLTSLTGAASSAPFTGTPLTVSVKPLASAVEPEKTVNAATVTLLVSTRYPTAWRTWFEDQLQAAGWGAGQYDVSCESGCALGAGGLGSVVVTLQGPRGDADDLQLTLAHGLSAVTIR